MINALYLEPVLDPKTNEYANVIIINEYPEGPLRNLVKQTRLPEVSQFKKTMTSKCKYILVDPDNQYMEIPFLFSYLHTNGYTIEYEQTKLYKNPYLICMISYTRVN